MASSALSLSRFLLMLRSTKRWWIPVLLLAVGGINVAGLFMPHKYESMAVVTIHDPNVESVASMSNKVWTVEDRLKTIRIEMQSPDFLAVVAAKVGLDAGLAPDTARYQTLLKKMAGAIDLQLKEQSYFTVAYRADRPETARDVTRAIVDLFIRNAEDSYAASAKKLKTGINEQLTHAQAELKAAQEAVMQYQRDHFNEIPQAADSHLKSLNDLTIQKQSDINNLASTQEKLILARERLKKMDPNVPSAPVGVQGQTALQKALDDKNALEMQLNLLLKDFTPSHPRVIEAQGRLDELNRQIQDAQGKSATGETTSIPNRDYVELQTQISQLELDARRLQGNIDQQGRAIAQINQYLIDIPKLKVPLDQLENERRLKEEQVDRLNKSLFNAEFGKAMDLVGMGPSFELTSPPKLELNPVSPNPKKIAALSVAAGLAACLGLVYLFTIFDVVVRSLEEARAVLQMPILGVVQRIMTPQEELLLKRRRRRRILGSAAALVLILVAVTVGLLFFRDPLEQSMAAVLKLVNQW